MEHEECKPEQRIRKKAKKNSKKKKEKPAIPYNIKSDRTMKKYWAQRYKLFSKYDEGIRLDTGQDYTQLLYKML